MAITSLPKNPSTSTAEVGKDFLLYVNTSTDPDPVTNPVWTLVGGQRNSGLSRSAESIDVSHKTSGGWACSKAGLRSWSVGLDGLYIRGDVGIEALEFAFVNGYEVNVKIEYPSKDFQTGWGSITDFSLDVPHDGEASISGTIAGNGALSEMQTPATI